MAEKLKTEVVIGGKVVTISGYESEAYMQKVALYINQKIQELDVIRELRYLPADLKQILIQINIADELMKIKEQTEQLEADLRRKEDELSEIKQELVAAQMKLEKLEGKKKR